MKRSLLVLAGLACLGGRAFAIERVRFIVVDPITRELVAGARVTVEDLHGGHTAARLSAGFLSAKPTAVFDLKRWSPADREDGVTTITIPLDTPVTLQGGQEPPVKDIYIKVTATRIVVKPNDTSGAQTRNKEEISKFVNTAGGDTKKLTKGQSGVAEDSAGQQHVRGEHTDITYVVDGVPLPDTLSGRQGSIVVPSTIESLEIITSGFAPEFGGQTAAVLNISTLPSAKKAESDGTLQGGTFGTLNMDFTSVGPFKRGSYVVNLGATRTNNAFEPQQPDNQTAHNRAEDLNLFGKVRFNAGPRDSLTLTASKNPGRLQNSNRTGLDGSFADVGQGYGFLGLRNADGTRPDAGNGGMGSDPLLLPSQQDAGQDIYLKEVSEFATLNWIHRLRGTDTLQMSLTGLHSGQDVRNNNPLVDVLNLPIDNSIEYNPIATRNVHHLQFEGSYAAKRGAHSLKTGVLYDYQSGTESYQITPASRLALNALAALDPRLVPAGTFETDAGGNPILDVNGNQVFDPTSGTIPILAVKRTGYYAAAYMQDTWKPSKQFTVNYGLRGDWYKQTQDIGDPVTGALISPRVNASYALDRRDVVRASYNRLFNTPPLAQGSIVGAPIQPETLDQYDISIERNTGPGQSLKVAYYMKDIKNQVDVGLLIPGSQIGLYSAVTLARGGVHGVEVSYDVSDYHGWDAYFNYTLSAAKPNGVDNTGADVETFNDHDQRHTLGVGVAYSWKSGASVAGVFSYGSGLASSPLGEDLPRVPRFQLDLRFTTGDHLFAGHGGLGLDIENVFDSRRIINFQSAFSGTRFQQGRRILISGFFKF